MSSHGESKRSTAGWCADEIVQLGHSEYWGVTMLAPSNETQLAIITFIHQHQLKGLTTTKWSSQQEQQRLTMLMATTASINGIIDEAIRMDTTGSIMDTIKSWPIHSAAMVATLMSPWTNERLNTWKAALNHSDPSQVHVDNNHIGTIATIVSLLFGCPVWLWRRDGRFAASLVLTVDTVYLHLHNAAALACALFSSCAICDDI